MRWPGIELRISCLIQGDCIFVYIIYILFILLFDSYGWSPLFLFFFINSFKENFIEHVIVLFLRQARRLNETIRIVMPVENLW